MASAAVARCSSPVSVVNQAVEGYPFSGAHVPMRSLAPSIPDTCPLSNACPPLVRRSFPPLMKALRKKCAKDVQDVLAEDPSSACAPFFDHRQATPLCCAIRCGCDVDIIELLLAHGADASATDEFGRTPVEILHDRYGELSLSHQDKAQFVAFIISETRRLNQIRAALQASCGTATSEPFAELVEPSTSHDDSPFGESSMEPRPPVPDFALLLTGILSN
eukprot:TRINITY_DN30270_c1_g6_i1.p1 TRINITY_DN30270_c1_g6~~TRINITY_DN30270_c1_g6_i1.p1  ORF type:complete len:236 (+),score=27.00 TRINITY_DN30270_c1_g6_i1:51-710(+)